MGCAAMTIELNGLILITLFSISQFMFPTFPLPPKSTFHIPLCPSSVCYGLCCIPSYNKSMATARPEFHLAQFAAGDAMTLWLEA